MAGGGAYTYTTRFRGGDSTARPTPRAFPAPCRQIIINTPGAYHANVLRCVYLLLLREVVLSGNSRYYCCVSSSLPCNAIRAVREDIYQRPSESTRVQSNTKQKRPYRGDQWKNRWKVAGVRNAESCAVEDPRLRKNSRDTSVLGHYERQLEPLIMVGVIIRSTNEV